MKNPFKEIVYLGLGAAVMTKHKADELLEKLVTKHHTTRDEGERMINGLKTRMQKTKQSADTQVEDFIDRIAKKTSLAKDEISESIQQMLEKPKKAKKQVTNKTHALTNKIVEKSTMTRDQANDMLNDFLDEVMLIKSEGKKEAKKLSRQIREMSDQGKAIADDLEMKSKVLLKEVKPRTQKAMDKVIDSLHLANNEDVHSLEDRVDELEQKETTK